MSADPVRPERRGAGWPGVLRRLLLVDQDTWCRGIADGVLRGRGYRVVCTGDLPTAVQIAREMLPDLVLVDVRLTLQTDDGAIVHVHYEGRGDAATGVTCAAPLFETSDERYAWLTRIQAVGKSVFDGTKLEYEIFEVA